MNKLNEYLFGFDTGIMVIGQTHYFAVPAKQCPTITAMSDYQFYAVPQHTNCGRRSRTRLALNCKAKK